MRYFSDGDEFVLVTEGNKSQETTSLRMGLKVPVFLLHNPDRATGVLWTPPLQAAALARIPCSSSSYGSFRKKQFDKEVFELRKDLTSCIERKGKNSEEVTIKARWSPKVSSERCTPETWESKLGSSLLLWASFGGEERELWFHKQESKTLLGFWYYL